MCLAMSHGMGQQQQQRAMLTGVVYANAAAQLMKMIYVSSAHQANNTADIDSASSLYHDYVSLHFYQPGTAGDHASATSGPSLNRLETPAARAGRAAEHGSVQLRWAGTRRGSGQRGCLRHRRCEGRRAGLSRSFTVSLRLSPCLCLAQCLFALNLFDYL